MPKGQAQVILQYLKSHRGQWVGLPILAEVSGANRVSARIHDLRHKLGHVIENKKEIGNLNPKTGTKVTKSYYKLVA